MSHRHWLALTLLLPPALSAQVGTHPCASEIARDERLACYDRVFPPPPENLEAARARIEAGFGLAGPRNAPDEADRLDASNPHRIESRVIKVDRPGTAHRVFRLENGQAWTQTDARGAGQVRVGDTVQVRKGLVGGYMLVMPNGVSVRVRRTR